MRRVQRTPVVLIYDPLPKIYNHQGRCQKKKNPLHLYLARIFLVLLVFYIVKGRLPQSLYSLLCIVWFLGVAVIRVLKYIVTILYKATVPVDSPTNNAYH